MEEEVGGDTVAGRQSGRPSSPWCNSSLPPSSNTSNCFLRLCSTFIISNFWFSLTKGFLLKIFSVEKFQIVTIFPNQTLHMYFHFQRRTFGFWNTLWSWLYAEQYLKTSSHFNFTSYMNTLLVLQSKFSSHQVDSYLFIYHRAKAYFIDFLFFVRVIFQVSMFWNQLFFTRIPSLLFTQWETCSWETPKLTIAFHHILRISTRHHQDFLLLLIINWMWVWPKSYVGVS